MTIRSRDDRIDAESKVSGNPTTIPPQIRRELDIDDGDHLRWRMEDGTIRVDVGQQEKGTSAEFEGDEGDCRNHRTRRLGRRVDAAVTMATPASQHPVFATFFTPLA